jgi:energy-coupling factor transport system permease protein
MRRVHPWAWVGWLVAALVALSVTRNPLHLTLILLCIGMVRSSMGGEQEATYSPISPVRFAMWVVPLSALFNGATAHFGDTVLLRLPEGLPVIGGAITLEALAFGAINGLVLSGILAAFATFNQALPIRALIRLIPRAFYPLAVVISISVTFVPVTMRQFQQIREAQAVRGHRVRGLRGWLPLFMPLLIGGLERALQLAEAMTARGFASADQRGQDTASRGAVLTGLVALLGGWLLRLVWGQESLGLGLMLGGAGLILGVLWALGRRVPRTTYRSEPWRWRDGAVALGAALALGVFLIPGIAQESFFYYPYPKLSMPGFDPVMGVATLGLLGPAFLGVEVGGRERDGGERGPTGDEVAGLRSSAP